MSTIGNFGVNTIRNPCFLVGRSSFIIIVAKQDECMLAPKKEQMSWVKVNEIVAPEVSHGTSDNRIHCSIPTQNIS